MAIACTVVTPASDVALSMAFMTQNVYAENIQTTFPDGWNKDDKDDKKDDKNNTGSGNTDSDKNTGNTGNTGTEPTPTLGAVESPTPTPTAKVFTRCVTVKQKNHYYGIMTMM